MFFLILEKVFRITSRSMCLCVFRAFCVCVCVCVCVFGSFCVCVYDEKSLRTPCSAKWGCSATSQLQSAFCNLSATAKPLSIVLQEFQENFKIKYCSLENILKLSATASLDFYATSTQLPSLSAFSYK